MQNTLQGGLHWTFLQLIAFGMMDKIQLPDKYMDVVRILVAERLGEFDIRFTNVLATPNNLLLIGYPTSDCNEMREEIRVRLMRMGYPLFEPYKADIFHMTLLRFVEPLTVSQAATINEIVAETGPYQDQTLALLRVQHVCISRASWKMQEQELQDDDVIKFNLRAQIGLDIESPQ